jgi:o-succinylbenzoate synthase
VKKFLLLELRDEGFSGWRECVAEEGPFYSPETISTASSILTSFLLPLVLGKSVSSPEEFERLAMRIRGNRMAKAAVECALRDLFAKAAGVPLGKSLGGSREMIEVGVSLGISPTPKDTVENVRKHVAEGYRRIKLKIEPGCDADRLAAVREVFPDITLTVDANAAYTLAQADTLRALDAFRQGGLGGSLRAPLRLLARPSRRGRRAIPRLRHLRAGLRPHPLSRLRH